MKNGAIMETLHLRLELSVSFRSLNFFADIIMSLIFFFHSTLSQVANNFFAKKLLMLFQCPYFTIEATLQNSQ